MVEVQTGKMIIKLITDNGLEFVNGLFNNYCKDTGISIDLTVLRTPQQDGLVKRINMTLLNKVRYLLSDYGMQRHFGLKQ